MLLDMNDALESKIEFYKKDIDNRFSVNGFQGTWAISDHTLIPQVFFGFLQRHFGVMRLRRIKIEEINKVLNELWEGPGSLEKIFRLENELYKSGATIRFTATDIAKIKKYESEEDEVLDDLPLSKFNDFDDDDDENE